MRRKLPTVLVLMVMVLVGAMYWVDLSYYTDPATGFVSRGAVWQRYVALLLPLLMALLGLRTVGPRSISALRVRNRALGVVFFAAAAMGVVWAGALVLLSVRPLSVYHLVLGGTVLFFVVWMLLAGLQLFGKRGVSPTRSAFWGILASLPFCMVTVYRILVRPSGLWRVGPVVRALTGLVILLWFGMLLRSFYIALSRRRMRWLYLLGVFAFLFATCLELPLAVHTALFAGGSTLELVESISFAVVGLAAGAVSVALAGQGGAEPKPLPEDETEEE